MNNLKVVLFLAFVILVAGCTSSRPVKISASDGLQINEFTADITDVFGAESVLLGLEVENVGGTTAGNVKAQLFGGASTWTGQAATIKNIGTLSPPLLDSNVPGDFKRETWSITAPDLAQGLTQTYDIGVRVTYDYTTTSITAFDIISYDQFDQLRKQGQFTQSSVATTNSNAPIKIEFEALSPMRPDSAGGSISESIILKVTNVGSGVAFKKGQTLGTGTIGKVDINIVSGSDSTLTCDFAAAGFSANEVSLKRGFDTVKIPCTFTATPATGLPKETKTVTATASYSYAIDNSISMKVTSKN